MPPIWPIFETNKARTDKKTGLFQHPPTVPLMHDRFHSLVDNLFSLYKSMQPFLVLLTPQATNSRNLFYKGGG